MGKISLLVAFTFITVACASGNCQRKHKTTKTPKKVLEAQAKKRGDIAVPKLAPVERRVLVYKYDGSRQCGQGKVISLKKMEKSLKGIKIFSRQRKNDGLMHIQVCGSATGRANVYEILAKDLEKAQKAGFKVWKF